MEVYNPPIVGMVPPHSIDLECSVLGMILLYSEAYESVEDLVNENIFYKEEHKIIFNAIKSVNKNKSTIDLLTVINELIKIKKLDEVGGPHYVSELTNRVSSMIMIDTHVKLLIEKSMLRSVIKFCGEFTQRAYRSEEDTADILDSFQSEAMKLATDYTPSREISLSEAVIERLKYTEGEEMPNSFTETHISELNEATNGLGEGNLIVLAARPSNGKSALGLDIGREVAKKGEAVGVFSIEMLAKEIASRAIAAETDISTLRLNNLSELTSDEWSLINSKEHLYNLKNLYIDDSPYITLHQLKAKIRRWYKNKGVKTIIIDYLQLIKGNPKLLNDTNKQIGEITGELKKLAQELGIKIILLSQLNRDVDKRGGYKIPQLSDLRESGSIEQDADTVIFIVNPEIYGFGRMTINDEEINVENKVIIVVAKCRHGKTTTFLVDKSKSRMKYTDSIKEGFSSINNTKDNAPF